MTTTTAPSLDALAAGSPSTETSTGNASATHRALVLAYGSLIYAGFLATFLYAIGFVTGLWVPKAINDGAAVPMGEALLVNASILMLFAVQHTIMARPGFKAWWTRIVPAAVERSTFVLATCMILGLLFWQWRPLPFDGVLWTVTNPIAVNALWTVCALGWGLVLYATFLIDHFDLFGLRQVVLHFRGKPYTDPKFQEKSMYRLVRHPLLLGFAIAFWATPVMTWSHLLFAAMTTLYMLVGIEFEERDLLAAHGDSYREYRRRVPMLLPLSALAILRSARKRS